MEYYHQNFPREEVLKCDQSTWLRESTAFFLGAYAVWIIGWRLWMRRNKARFLQCCVFYECMFLCTVVTLTLSAFAFYFHRPVIATALCTVVGIDHILWYVDLAFYFAWQVIF
jgi:hypothetical protein